MCPFEIRFRAKLHVRIIVGGVAAPYLWLSQSSSGELAGEETMSGQFLIGFVVSIVNIVIHALVMTVVVQMVRSIGANVNNPKWPAVLLSAVMVVTVLILMAAHTSEVIVWSLAYQIVDAAPTGTDLVYFAFVNYTTLGYGDITHVKTWQLLGPITAMNGLLLFGWSTAVIFEVLRRAMVRINLVGMT